MTMTWGTNELDALESVARWWRDAGVDVLISEEPRHWLVKTDAPQLRLAKATPAPLPFEDLMPATLTAFQHWLMQSPDIPEAGPPSRRITPTGDAASDLMILADIPERADLEEGHLLSGDLNLLFEKMLAALGRDRSSVYLASLCPGRPPTGLLAAAGLERLSEIARAHIRLVAPKQLWLLGTTPSRAILGIDDAAAKGKLHQLNLDGFITDTIATAHPRMFGGSKARKAAAWAEMQRLNSGIKT